MRPGKAGTMLPIGALRQHPDQGRQAAHRPLGTQLATGQARSLWERVAGQRHNRFVSSKMSCTCVLPVRAICAIPDTPPAWSPQRAFLTSVGTRVRPYRTLGERPVVLHPRSYRTLGGVPGGGVAWYRRRRSDMPMCSARKTAGQHLRLHRKGLDIDARFATKPVGMHQVVCTGSTASFSRWSHNAEIRRVRLTFLGVCHFANHAPR